MPRRGADSFVVSFAVSFADATVRSFVLGDN
jgi:hypothetical protein